MKKLYLIISFLTIATLSLLAVNPVISTVSCTTPGPYIKTDVVTITITFNQAVTILGGTPTLLLETGTTDREAVYAGTGASSTTHDFTYTVQDGDESSKLNYKSINSLFLNGATIANAGLETAIPTLPDMALTTSLGNSNIVVDGIAPYVVNVTSSTPNGTYQDSYGTISIQVEFNEIVTWTAGSTTTQLTLAGTNVTAPAPYNTGTGSNTLTFLYDIDANSNTSDLDYAATSSLDLGTGGKLTDANGNAITTVTLPSPGAAGSLSYNKNIALDNTPPTVSSVVFTSANTTYKVGDYIYLNVTFDEPVVVTGNPRLGLDQVVDYAYYYSGTGTSVLAFRYKVQEGQTATALQSVVNTLTLNSGTLKNLAGIDFVFPTTPASAATTINVDGDSPVVISVTSTAGVYKINDAITINVVFDQIVTVTYLSTYKPRLLLETGSTDQYAEYASASPTSGTSHAFTYTVQPWDTTNSLTFKNISALIANGATLLDANGNAAILGLTAAGPIAQVVGVDGIAPYVTNVTSTNDNGSYTAGATINITVKFNEFFLTGGANTTTTLTIAGGTATCTTLSGVYTDSLAFSYTVLVGDNTSDLDYPTINSLAKGTLTLTDKNGNANTSTTLPALGGPGSLAYNKNITLDNSAPTVSSIAFTSANATYKVGDYIYLNVTFNEPVVVTGNPRLELNTTPADYAYYTSGTGTNKLKFRYQVVEGQTAADLDYIDDKLALNSGTILNLAGIAILDAAGLITTPDPTPASHAIVVEGHSPVVSTVTSSAGTYNIGDAITITVAFDESVTVTYSNISNKPRLQLETGSTDRYAEYASASPTSGLSHTFTYTVQPGDTTNSLNFKYASSLVTNGATILDVSGNKAILDLTTAASISPATVKVDGIAPYVTNVTSTTLNGSYKAGNLIVVTVKFNESVTLSGGAPTLTLAGAGALPNAVYNTGSGTNTLSFNYTTQADASTQDLDYVSSAALNLLTNTLFDINSNVISTVTLPAPGTSGSLGKNKNIIIENTQPTITAVSTTATANTIYRIGQRIYIYADFSEPVLVNITGTDKPYIELDLDSPDKNAVYSSGNKSSRLVFAYTVVESDLETTAINYLTLNSFKIPGLTTIKDKAGNPALVTLVAPGSSVLGTKLLKIDGVKPTVSTVAGANPSTTYKSLEAKNITVTFSESVIISGTAKLLLETGTTDRYATSVGDGVTPSLSHIFIYTVQPDDYTDLLNYKKTTSLSGTIKDVGGNSAIRTLPDAYVIAEFPSSLANSNIKVDAKSPTVTNVTSTAANGYYSAGDVITITVEFSEPLIVGTAGNVQLTLETGTTDRTITTAAAPGQTLSFNYTVLENDNNLDLDYNSINALVLSGATLTDVNLNNAVLTLPKIGGTGSLSRNKTLTVDALASGITSVTSSNSNGSYGTGKVIYIKVNFNEKVVVVGQPFITLETGTTDRDAMYSSGSSSNVLTFKYIVQSGDIAPDLGYVNTSSLNLNTGTINDLAANAATLTLPTDGSGNSLKDLKAINISGAKSGQVTTGLAEDFTNETFDFTVYPNPASSEFQIQTQGCNDEAQIEIYNLTGQIIYSTKEKMNEPFVIQNNFEAGIYIIKLTYNDAVITKNLIIE